MKKKKSDIGYYIFIGFAIAYFVAYAIVGIILKLNLS